VNALSRRGLAAEDHVEHITRQGPAALFADWRPVVATGAAFFMIVLDTSIVNLALARVGTEFHAGLETLQWLVDSYALVFASLLLGAGALGDRYGTRRTFLGGLVVFTLASALCALAPSIEALQGARIMQGIGAALLLPNSLAALNHTFTDPLRHSKAVSAWASAGALGVAVGPVLGGLLVQMLGWRSIFIVNLPVGLAALWMTWRHIPKAPVDRARSLDPLGQLLAVVTLATATYALIGVSHATANAASLWAAGACSLALGIGFVILEARHESPMLPLPLLRRRTLGPVALVGLLHNVAIYGLIFVLSLSFQRLRDLDPLGAGLMFLPLTLALAVGTRLGAVILRNRGPFPALIGGHAAAALGALVLATFGWFLPPAALCLPLIVLGCGGGITTPAMSLAVLGSVERTQGGLASGTLNSARQAGGVIGVAVLGALLGEPATSAGAEAAEYVAAGVLCLTSGVAFAASQGWHMTAPGTQAVSSGQCGGR
jgi:MFS transporter, DHA2 family, methylenomycin A resistance protein